MKRNSVTHVGISENLVHIDASRVLAVSRNLSRVFRACIGCSCFLSYCIMRVLLKIGIVKYTDVCIQKDGSVFQPAITRFLCEMITGIHVTGTFINVYDGDIIKKSVYKADLISYH